MSTNLFQNKAQRKSDSNGTAKITSAEVGQHLNGTSNRRLVSTFKSCKETKPVGDMPLAEVLAEMTTDKFKITNLRQTLATAGKEAYNELKRKLPAFTPAGTFTTRHKSNLIQHNGIVHHDVDGLTQAESTAIKEKLKDDPQIAYVFHSPSYGLKLGFIVKPVKTDAEYKVAWAQTAEYLKTNYCIEVDQSGKDISRLCYVSFDPDLYQNPSAKLFDVKPVEPPKSKPKPKIDSTIPPEVKNECAQNVINCVCNMLDKSVDGNRHVNRRNAGYMLGGAVGAGWITNADALEAAEEAVEKNTNTPLKAIDEFMDAMSAGIEKPLPHEEWVDKTSEARRLEDELQRLQETQSETQQADEANDSEASEQRIISTATPRKTAKLYLEHHHPDQTLKFECPDIWRAWDGRVYSVVEEQQLRASVSEFLDGSFTYDSKLQKVVSFATTPHRETDVLREMKNLVTLATGVRCPCWVGATGPDPKNMVSFQNGHLDIDRFLKDDKRTMLEHTPTWYSVNCLPHDFRPEAECPQWLAFLKQVFENDAERIRFLQQWFGYCLTTDTSLEKFLILWGPPRSGKGTITTVLGDVLGSHNIATPRLRKLGSEFGLHSLLDKLIALVPDAHLPQRDTSSMLETIKAITGNDCIDIERKHRESIDNVKLAVRIIISTNELPRFFDNSSALADRAIIIPFHESFRGKEDTTLKSRLRSEVIGVTNWALDGLADLRRNGLQIPAICGEMDAIFRESISTIGTFVDACCDIGPDCFEKRKTLHDAYCRWCVSEGHHSVSSHRFLPQLLTVAPRIKRGQRRMAGKRPRTYEGIRLSDEFAAQLKSSDRFGY